MSCLFSSSVPRAQTCTLEVHAFKNTTKFHETTPRSCATTSARVEYWLSSRPSSCVSLRGFSVKFLHFLLARFPLGNLERSFVATSYLAVTRSVSGCCLWITQRNSSRDSVVIRPQCLALRWIHVLQQYGLDESTQIST